MKDLCLRKYEKALLNSYASEDADSGLAQGSIDMDASSGSAAAVVMAELLEGASLGSLEARGSGLSPPMGQENPKNGRLRRVSRAALLVRALNGGADPEGLLPEDEPNSAGTVASGVVSARTARKRRIAGIFQHYYPEGDWGYVILLCGFLVQLLAHGLQQSLAIIVFPLSNLRFQVANDVSIGKENYQFRFYLDI